MTNPNTPNSPAGAVEPSTQTADAAEAVGSTQAPTVLTGVAAFFGTWPGDETDEELLAALWAIR